MNCDNFSNDLSLKKFKEVSKKFTKNIMLDVYILQVALKKPESEKIKWKVISDKRPNEKLVGESKFRLDYILGPSEPITTTMKPNITTPRLVCPIFFSASS